MEIAPEMQKDFMSKSVQHFMPIINAKSVLKQSVANRGVNIVAPFKIIIG